WSGGGVRAGEGGGGGAAGRPWAAGATRRRRRARWRGRRRRSSSSPGDLIALTLSPRHAQRSRHMRAIIVREPGDETVLQLGDAPPPALGPADVRIRVRATAVNRAALLQRQGMYPPPSGASEILGLEGAGDLVGM